MDLSYAGPSTAYQPPRRWPVFPNTPVPPTPAPMLAPDIDAVPPWRPWLAEAPSADVVPEPAASVGPIAPIAPIAAATNAVAAVSAAAATVSAVVPSAAPGAVAMRGVNAPVDSVRQLLLAARAMPRRAVEEGTHRAPAAPLSGGPFPRGFIDLSHRSAFHVPPVRRAHRIDDAPRVSAMEVIGNALRALRIVASIATRRVRLPDKASMAYPVAAEDAVERYDARQVLIAAYLALTERGMEGEMNQTEFAALLQCIPSTFSDWRHEYRDVRGGAAHLWALIAPDSDRFPSQIVARLRAEGPAAQTTIADVIASPMCHRLMQVPRGGDVLDATMPR